MEGSPNSSSFLRIPSCFWHCITSTDLTGQLLSQAHPAGTQGRNCLGKICGRESSSKASEAGNWGSPEEAVATLTCPPRV